MQKKSHCYLTTYTKSNSKWITELNVRPKPIKLQEENGKSFIDIGLVNDFLYVTPKAKATKAKTGNLD